MCRSISSPFPQHALCNLIEPRFERLFTPDSYANRDSKRELWAWKGAVMERLARLRLIIHETRAQVVPGIAGIPWLGFVVYPTHRRVKGRKVRSTHRRLRSHLAAYHAGEISFAELDAAVRGWIAHVGHADSWGLRQHALDTLVIRPNQHRRALAARST